MTDIVNHPPHYISHPSGVECITVTEHMGFNLGNAVKYIWRADLKGTSIEDLEKAEWYLKREIEKRKNASPRVLFTNQYPNTFDDGHEHNWCNAVTPKNTPYHLCAKCGATR